MALQTSFFKNTVLYFHQHWFVRSVALLQVGSFVGNILQALAGVVLARMLQPTQFGRYALAMSLSSLVVTLCGLNLSDAASALVGEAYARQDRPKIAEILAFFLRIAGFMAIILLVVLPLMPIAADRFYSDANIGVYGAIVVAASLVSVVFFSTTSLTLQVVGKMKALTALTISDQFVRFGLSILFVLFGTGLMGAMTGHLIGSLVIAVVSVILWHGIISADILIPRLSDIRAAISKVRISKYLSFSFWVAVDRNIAMLYGILPVLMLGLFAGTEEVTFFKLAFGYLNLALSLLVPISILLNVEFPRMKVIDQKVLYRNFWRVTFYAIAISVILTGGALLVAPTVFRILYGESFLPSVRYVYGLAMYGALFGLGVGLGPMWRAINAVKVSIFINIVTLCGGVLAGIWALRVWGSWGAVGIVTAWYTISHLVSFLYLVRKLKT